MLSGSGSQIVNGTGYTGDNKLDDGGSIVRCLTD